MSKTINFLKSWSVRILTLPTVVKLLHTFWQTFLAVFLVGIFAVKDSATLYALIVASLAAALSALKSVLVQAMADSQINIPGRDS